MVAPLNGVTVLELGSYAFVPYATAILADWGATVIKVENPSVGDPLRDTSVWDIPPREGLSSYLFAAANRNKRSITLDLASPGGRAVLSRLLARSDMFVTNMLPAVRKRLKVDVDDVRRDRADIIYGRGSGFGPRGPEAEKPGFDQSVYWSRSGVAAAVTPADAPYPLRMPGPAFGDSQASIALAAGLMGALFTRERTGQAPVVDASLLASGLWAMQTSIAGLSTEGLKNFTSPDRMDAASNPLAFTYKTQDGYFLQFSMLQSDRYWPGFCRSLECEGLISDPRFADARARSENRGGLVEIIDQILGAKPLAHWRPRLDIESGPWTVVTPPGELPMDPQALANNYVQRVSWAGEADLPLVSAPVQFDEMSGPLAEAPAMGADTEEILLEHGYGWADILALKDSGVIG